MADYGAPEYATRTSDCLRTAFDRIARYHRLLNDRARLVISTERGLTRVSYLRPGELAVMPPACVDFVLAQWVLGARDLADVSVTPIATFLPYPTPATLTLHREVFGPGVRFDTGLAELHFDTSLVVAPLPRADLPLGQALVRARVAAVSGRRRGRCRRQGARARVRILGPASRARHT